MTWHKYYYRIIGFALTPASHECWGLVMIIAGSIFISRKPHGKE